MVTSLTRNGQRSLESPYATPSESELGRSLALPDTPLFGTDGIRAKVGDFLNAPFALQLGFWAGQVLQASATTMGPVIVGQDSRNSSDMLAMAIAAGLTSAGLEVWNIGLCPTPCVAYLTRQSGAIGGIMISASHNPPEDNGIKFFSQAGTKLSQTLAQQIESGLRGHLPLVSSVGNWGKIYQQSSLVDRYCQFLQQTLSPTASLDRMRVVLDLAWGAAVNVAPAIFQALGAEVICLHERPDGDRINVNCGSTHLHHLQTALRDYHADLGFAFDGDADRVMAVDAQGRRVDGDYILYLWGKALLEARQLPDNLIVGTVMANLGFERAWAQLGGKLIRTAVGDQYVQAQMWETGAMLGGEQSGHIICHHHSLSGDGIQTALHLAALIHQCGNTLAELVDRSFQTFPQILRNVRVEDCERRRHWQTCEPLQQAIALAEAEMGATGRILVRPSGTEPLIRVMVEAESTQFAQYWVKHLVEVVEQHLTV